MKNNYSQTVILFIFMLVSALLNAQDFQGEATYKTSRKMDFKMDSIGASQGIDKEMQGKLNAMLQKQFQKEYKLTFNASESIYKQEGKLAAPTPGSGGMTIMVMGGGSESTSLYKNTKEKRYGNKEDIMGKVFLIQDSLKNTAWKLESETKFIGQYTCYKATRTKEVERIESSSMNDVTDEPKRTKETITITAWYTLEIPVNTGPGMYWGLPGLILEVNDGSETIICSKIVLNPKDKITIKEPVKGKKVNQAAFEKIMEKKSKEMMERYRGNGKDTDGHFEMRIGG
jgi:GLPGLI family protein